MKDPIQKYFQVGTIQWMTHPPVDYPLLESVKAICCDEYFSALEITHIEDQETRDKVKDMLAQGHMKVCYGAQPRLLGPKLNPNDLNEEGRKKAHRHQAMRRGKGFVTIEQPVDICRALEKVKTGTVQPVILVECISNLTANEMFLGEGRQRTAEETGEKIVRDIGMLKKAAHLVVITNNVFEDGIVYEEPVMEYIRAMGRINGALAGMADKVVEVVAGIPVMIKDTGGM